MGDTTLISWADATFNPWMGCARVSPACEHCYAETLVTGRLQLPVWGPPSTTGRTRTAASTWKKPRQWDRAAAKAGKRVRVFCASLADVFEDHPALVPWRAELLAMVEGTPNLDWLLLTKRPQNIVRMVPPSWLEAPRPNVWLGTTVEDQKRADARIPHLLACAAAVRFLSCEPLLERVDLSAWLTSAPALTGPREAPRVEPGARQIDWVIIGGESGPGARTMALEWAGDLVAQCRAAGVAPFVKQAGARPTWDGEIVRLRDRKGGDMGEWPAGLDVREFPEVRDAAG